MIEVFFNRPGAPLPLDRLRGDIRSAQVSLDVAMAWFTHDGIAQAIIDSPAEMKALVLNGADLSREGGAGRRVVERIFEAQARTARDDHWSNFMVTVLGSPKYAEGIMHHKFIIIDQRIVWTGSYNLTYHAAKNYETLLRITDDAAIEAFSQEFFELIWEKGRRY